MMIKALSDNLRKGKIAIGITNDDGTVTMDNFNLNLSAYLKNLYWDDSINSDTIDDLASAAFSDEGSNFFQSDEELKLLVKKLGKNKAIGCDELRRHPKTEGMPEQNVQRIAVAKIIALSKTGTAYPSSFKMVRTIAILPTVTKLVETAILWKMQKHISENNLICAAQ